MKALILAAGKGIRLRPLTYGIPKPLLPVGGIPVIDYVINNIQTHPEVDEIYIGTNYMQESIVAYFKNKENKIPVHVKTTLFWETGGDLKVLATEADVKDTFIVCNGDIVSKINIDNMVNFHKAHDGLLSVSLFKVPKQDIPRFGIADYDTKTKKIRRFVEKPKLSEAPSNLANAGVYVMEKEVLDYIPNGKVRLETTAFKKLAEEGLMYGFIDDIPFWMDIGTIEAYNEANHVLLKGVIAPPTNGKKGGNGE